MSGSKSALNPRPAKTRFRNASPHGSGQRAEHQRRATESRLVSQESQGEHRDPRGVPQVPTGGEFSGPGRPPQDDGRRNGPD